jgi:phosphatidylglycerol---prolipoprotein diacylglyceryl transferase
LFDPQIPYIPPFEIPLVPSLDLTIKPFGTLVALGVYMGWLVANRQAKRLGFSLERFGQFVAWTLAGGFIGGHVFDVILYHNSRLFDQGLVEALKDLLFIWRSQASFGGFMGAVLGMLVWRNRFKIKSVLPYCDTMASGFPVGWVFGRSGCSVAHDHPGLRLDQIPPGWEWLSSIDFLAVRYPTGARFDLGVIEMLITVPLALGFLYLMRKPRPWGFYIGAMSVYYAPIRFCLDFLRARQREPGVGDVDVRHFGLTPAQWLCIGLFAVGAFMLARAIAAARRGETPSYGGRGPDGGPDGDPVESAEGDDEEDEGDDGDDAADEPASSKAGPASDAAPASAPAKAADGKAP